MQMNENMTALHARIASIENTIEQVHENVETIAREIDNRKRAQQQPEQQDDYSESSTSPTTKGGGNMVLSNLQANWSLSLTPSGLRIDTNIVSLHDLYDILLSGLSKLQLNNNEKVKAASTTAATTTTHPISSGSSSSKASLTDSTTRSPSSAAEEAVVIKRYPLYKSKDIIFPLYSAWEEQPPPSSSSGGSSLAATTRPLAKPVVVDDKLLLRIYEECFLCLPLPDMDAFREQCKSCPLLINAVLSWSARHAAIYHGTFVGQDPNMVGEHFFATAKKLLKDVFLTPSIQTVHALLLMYIYSIGKTGPDRVRAESEAYTFLGLATRMSLDLGLHRELPSNEDDTMESEMRRRLFAAVEFLETLCAAHSDKPMLFPSDDEVTVRPPAAMDHEQGERRYRVEFTVHRHKINQIYRRIQTHISGNKDPLLATVSGLEKELKDWYRQLPDYFHYRSRDRVWATTSFCEQACLKLNFEYHFQMCQLYSSFLPPHPEEDSSAIALLSLQLCVDSADAITELLECWAQLRQPWCHFTLDTLVMACLIYSHQLRSSKRLVSEHAKNQMKRIAAVLRRSPVRHHKYVKIVMAQIERQVTEDDRGCKNNNNDWQLSSMVQQQQQQQPFNSFQEVEDEWSWFKNTPSAFDWAHADVAVNDLFRFADFVYTPTMDMEAAWMASSHHHHNNESIIMGYPWPS